MPKSIKQDPLDLHGRIIMHHIYNLKFTVSVITTHSQTEGL